METLQNSTRINQNSVSPPNRLGINCLQSRYPAHLDTTSSCQPRVQDIRETETVQQKPPLWWELEHLCCGEKLGELDMLTLEQRQVWKYLTAAAVLAKSSHRGQSWARHIGRRVRNNCHEWNLERVTIWGVLFCHKHSRAMAQAVQGGCAISVLGGF